MAVAGRDRGLEGRNAGSSSSSSARGPCWCSNSCCWKIRRAAADDVERSPEEVDAKLLFDLRRSGTKGEDAELLRRGNED